MSRLSILSRAAQCAHIRGALIKLMKKAAGGSATVWLPGVEEVQERLHTARSDLAFQGFLKTLGDFTEQRTGSAHNDPDVLT